MNGVKDFLEHASNFVNISRKVRCSCKKCVNINFKRIGVVRVHLLHTKWIFHNETIQNPINEEPKIEENVNEIIDVLNYFMEPDNRGDDVDE